MKGDEILFLAAIAHGQVEHESLHAADAFVLEPEVESVWRGELEQPCEQISLRRGARSVGGGQQKEWGREPVE